MRAYGWKRCPDCGEWFCNDEQLDSHDCDKSLLWSRDRADEVAKSKKRYPGYVLPGVGGQNIRRWRYEHIRSHRL
jgi:uncharacterized C2H2 Zn-finger protein